MGLEIGSLFVRRSTLINANPCRVWEEFKSHERVKAWFGIGHEVESYEAKVGGKIRLSADDGTSKRYFGGSILVFEDCRELSFTENWETDGYPFDCFITIRLTPLYEQCHSELFHHGLERIGVSAAAELQGHEEGWHAKHLGTLKEIVELQDR